MVFIIQVGYMEIGAGINNMVDMAASQGSSVNTNNLKSKIDAATKGKDDEALKKACKEFETYFIDQMMKEMRKTLSETEEDSLIPKSKGEDMFTEMKDSEYSKKATEEGGIGLAKLMYEQLKRSNPKSNS